MHTYIHMDIIYIYVYIYVRVFVCVYVEMCIYTFFILFSIPLENSDAIIWYHILGTFGLG